MPTLKLLKQITEKAKIEASEAYSKTSLSRNGRRRAYYRSNEVYDVVQKEEEEEEEDK